VKAAEIIGTLRDKNIELVVTNGDLRVRGGKLALSDPGLLDLIRRHKKELMDEIANGEHLSGLNDFSSAPPNLIPAGCQKITPEMLTLVKLSQSEIDTAVAAVPGGASNVQDIYPLAPLQEGIFFHHILENRGDVYLLPALVAFDSRRLLDRYVEALHAVINRHDNLRTSFAWEGLPEPVQVVWRVAPLVVEEVTPDPGGSVAAQLRARFNPRQFRIDIRHAPLLRLFIAEDQPNHRWVMMQLVHHLVTDHTSGELLGEEIEAHLAGREEQMQAPVPFRNFIAQARFGVSPKEHEVFFTGMLGDVKEPAAPFGFMDVQVDGSKSIQVQRKVGVDICHRLRARARSLGVSVASLCHVAWAMVLARLTQRDDVVFGTMMFGRNQGDGAGRVLGLLVNALPVRIKLGDDGAEVCVRKTHERLIQMVRHEHASLALAQRCSGVQAPTPLFTTMMNYLYEAPGVDGSQKSDQSSDAWEGIELLWHEERINYPLGWVFTDLGQGANIEVTADEFIDAEQVGEQTLTALESLVTALERTPATPVTELQILPPAERGKLLALGDGGPAMESIPGHANGCLYDLVAAQAENNPTTIAIIEPGRELTYDQLVYAANGVAWELHKLGAGPETRVAVLADRSTESLVGVLGVLAAGAAWVPLDPLHPMDRLTYTVDNSSVLALLTPAALAKTANFLAARCSALHNRILVIGQAPPNHLSPVSSVHQNNAAYVIYTSGTTGMPKGAVIEHRGAMNLVHAFLARHDLAHQRLLMIPPLVFDASVGDVFPILAAGSTLVLHPNPDELDAEELQRFSREYHVTAIDAPASLWRHWAEQFAHYQQPDLILPTVRLMMFGGETVPLGEIRRFTQLTRNRITLFNHYGPTEATVCAVMHATRDGAQSRGADLPIGKPLPGVRVYVLDEELELLPQGVEGELYIGGVGVARGYLGQSELSAKSFFRDPFSQKEEARIYKTGDIARWNRDGTLQFVGRRDQQVKIRGFRIQLSEIEARLIEHASVREAVVLAREDQPGDKRLVAYVTPASGEHDSALEIEVENLRVHLAAVLPEYMVPPAFVTLAKLPLTPNGKLDRDALPAPEADAYITRNYEAPIGEVESTLARIWAEVLKVDRVGRHDNFFHLGGHSLLAATLVERLRRVNLGADVRALFTTPTLAALAAKMAAEGPDHPSATSKRQSEQPFNYA
jgi:amino acid adenylation domain-containing protein